MVSLPERYFTYSAWMSAGGRSGTKVLPNGRGWTVMKATVPTARRPPTRPTALVRIRHPPDASATVVRDQERAVGKHEQRHRPAPAVAVGELPSRDEILARHRAAVLHVDANHLRARGDAAIPRSVKGDERVAAVFRRKGRPRVEGEPERRRVGLKGDGRRLDPGAVRVRVFRVRLAGEITLRPAVP